MVESTSVVPGAVGPIAAKVVGSALVHATDTQPIDHAWFFGSMWRV